MQHLKQSDTDDDQDSAQRSEDKASSIKPEKEGADPSIREHRVERRSIDQIQVIEECIQTVNDETIQEQLVASRGAGDGKEVNERTEQHKAYGS